MKKGNLYLLRKFYSFLHEWYISFYNKSYFISGIPTHTNLGDSVIALSEHSFLIKYEISQKN